MHNYTAQPGDFRSSDLPAYANIPRLHSQQRNRVASNITAANNITTDSEHRSMACIKQPPHLTTIRLCTQVDNTDCHSPKHPCYPAHATTAFPLRYHQVDHTYVSARVAYDRLEEGSPKRLTHLFPLHPLMIKHPLDIGIVVWTGVGAEEDK